MPLEVGEEIASFFYFYARGRVTLFCAPFLDMATIAMLALWIGTESRIRGRAKRKPRGQIFPMCQAWTNSKKALRNERSGMPDEYQNHKFPKF
jgi:hypothetical protein